MVVPASPRARLYEFSIKMADREREREKEWETEGQRPTWLPKVSSEFVSVNHKARRRADASLGSTSKQTSGILQGIK